MSEITPLEWDEWREHPLTKKAMAFIENQIEVRFGGEADRMMRDNYLSLLTSDREKIYFARLRGQIECAKEIHGILKEPLSDLIEEEKDEEDRPKGLSATRIPRSG